MGKILIALVNNLTREMYAQNFSKNNFEVITASNGKEAYRLAKKEKPEAIVADVSLHEMSGFELIKNLKKDKNTSRIPVLIYSRTGSNLHKKTAIKVEARDFINGVWDSPKKIVLKVKSHLGAQKGYLIHPSEDSFESLKEMADDLEEDAYCPFCKGNKSLYLIRDLSTGKNYFKVSLVCPKCSFKGPSK